LLETTITLLRMQCVPSRLLRGCNEPLTTLVSIGHTSYGTQQPQRIVLYHTDTIEIQCRYGVEMDRPLFNRALVRLPRVQQPMWVAKLFSDGCKTTPKLHISRTQNHPKNSTFHEHKTTPKLHISRTQNHPKTPHFTNTKHSASALEAELFCKCNHL
jgi:hypothetical protein